MRQFFAGLCVLLLGAVSIFTWQDITAGENQTAEVNRVIDIITLEEWNEHPYLPNTIAPFDIEFVGFESAVNVSTEADFVFTRAGEIIASETVH